MTVASGTQRWPLVARWIQSTEDGNIRWYLASLKADGKFWGYAHFRLQRRQENRNFAGTLASEVLIQVAAIVDQLASASPREQSGSSAGLIGIGTRSSLHLIFELPVEADKSLDPKLVAAYRSFVELLQPAATQALDDDVEECEE